MNYATDFKSIRNEVSAQEWQARLDLAACYRLVDAYGMTDLIYNHITARIPGTEHLLINLYGLLYKEITASSLVKIDVEGNIVAKPDTDYGINVSGYVIHGAIHKARPDVACVLHTHTRAGMAVAAMKCGLLPMSQTSIRFVGHIGYHDYEGPAIDTDERERLVRDLGPHDAMIMRNHGLLTCGATIQQAFNTMYQLEMSCRSQVDAMAARTELTMPGENVLAHTAHLYQPGTRRPYGVLEWPAMLRLLAAEAEEFGLSAVLALSSPDSMPQLSAQKLSAIVITRNEAANIGECLDGLAFCDERIVVDCGSTDGTADIARGKGARVEHHEWRGFGPQKNFALSLATGDWVLSIDADERVTPELADAIKAAMADAVADGFELPRRLELLRPADAAFRLVSRLRAAPVPPRQRAFRRRLGPRARHLRRHCQKAG